MESKKRVIAAADLFCGAGGTSQGLLLAANEIHADLSLIGVNHWQIAVNHLSPKGKGLVKSKPEVDQEKR